MVDTSPIVSGDLVSLSMAHGSSIVLEQLVTTGDYASTILRGTLNAIGSASSPVFCSRLPGSVVSSSPIVHSNMKSRQSQWELL